MLIVFMVFCIYGVNFVLFVYRKEVFYGLFFLCGIFYFFVVGVSGISYVSFLRWKVFFSFDYWDWDVYGVWCFDGLLVNLRLLRSCYE